MASVRKRAWQSGGEKKTAWVADYFDQAGKRHLKTFDKKKDADAWLVQTRHQVSQGTHTTGNITLAEAAELWIERARANGRERGTLEQYERHVRLHILPLLGAKVRLSQLSAPMVERFRDDLLKQCSWVMARKVLTSLKSLLADAQRRGLVGTNAAATVKVDGHKRERRRLAVGSGIPTKQEINAIFAAADETGGIGRPLLVTATLTGLRASELRGLRWSDVDFTRKTIHVRQRADAWNTIGRPKSAAGDRVIPMTPLMVKTPCVSGNWQVVPESSCSLPAPDVRTHTPTCCNGWWPQFSERRGSPNHTAYTRSGISSPVGLSNRGSGPKSYRPSSGTPRSRWCTTCMVTCSPPSKTIMPSLRRVRSP